MRRCLAKDPERRYQNMRDVVLELQEPPTESKAAQSHNWWPWLTAVCLVLAVTSVIGWAPWRGNRDVPAMASTLEINPPEGDAHSNRKHRRIGDFT